MRHLARPLVLVTALSGAALAAAPGTLLPVDEAVTRADFFSFRARLQQAIASRDAAAVLAVVDRNIRNSFGDNDGIEEFRKMWEPERNGSGLWRELGTVLSLGGSFHDERTFVAPYVFSKWPDGADPFEHVAVIGTEVRVRAAPRFAAPVLGTVSYAVLPLARQSEGTAEEWRAVTLDGRTGYIAAAFVRQSIDYRAIFSNTGGTWRLVSFVAGD